MKDKPICILFAALLYVVFGVTSAHSELCNSQKLSMCLQALDINNIPIDNESKFPNTRSVVMNFQDIPYGKAVIDQIKLHNTGIFDVLTISSNSVQSFPWAYLNLSDSNYVSVPSDYIWSIYSSSGLVIPSGQERIFDVAFAPVPEYELSGKQSHTFQQWNPFDVSLSSMTFEVTLNGSVHNSLGKKFYIDIKNADNGSKIVITPQLNDVNLGDNEYLLVYFEIVQKDGNPYKEVIVLHEDEDSILSKSLLSGQVDSSGSIAAYSHKEFSNGNILLRSRDTKYETKTKYWLLFKTADPITLKCHKRTIIATGSGYNTSGTAEADLKFVYADHQGNRVEDLQGVYATDNNTVPTNLQPYSPSNPNPVNGLNNVNSDNVLLSWNGGDPDDDFVSYTLYLSTSNTDLESPKYAVTPIGTTYNAGKLNQGTYYWKVIAKDPAGLTSSGLIWSFTVADADPVYKEAVIFFDNNGTNISATGLSLNKGVSVPVKIKIDPPSTSSITFILEVLPSDIITITDSSLTFYSGGSIGGFTITANTDITTPVTISLKTDNPAYKKADGTPYKLMINGNNPPIIISNGGGDTTNINVKNQQVAVTVVKADRNNATISYSITGGVDKDKFIIYEDGFLRFKDEKGPDIDNPSDEGKNNIYDVQVTVSDKSNNNLKDSQNIAVTVNEDNGGNIIDPPNNLSPGNKTSITQWSTMPQLSWEATTGAENDILNYIVEYWTDESDRRYVVVDSALTSASIPTLANKKTYYWRVMASDGKEIVAGETWTFDMNISASPVPNAQYPLKEIKSDNLLPAPVPLTQPLAVGDLTKELKLSYSFPDYSAAVDIYILMQYKNAAGNSVFFFITQSDTNSDYYEFTSEFKPLFSKSTTATSGTIFSVYKSYLKAFGLDGEYTFYSGVVPAGDSAFSKSDITFFSIKVE
ncbi:MAG: hypothetical protein HQK67_01870 [Desulfamplus sp.]|nr:hypothetical protein [Desulfamplus sp.]